MSGGLHTLMSEGTSASRLAGAALEQWLLALALPPDSVAAAAAHDATSASHAPLSSDDAPLVFCLANSTFGDLFSSGRIDTTAAGGHLPSGQIADSPPPLFPAFHHLSAGTATTC